VSDCHLAIETAPIVVYQAVIVVIL